MCSFTRKKIFKYGLFGHYGGRETLDFLSESVIQYITEGVLFGGET